MGKNNDIKAKNTYYEIANSEYDRILNYFDQIDNKVGLLIAIVIALPIATIGFASQLTRGDVNLIAVIFGSIGILAFLGAGYYIYKAIVTRDVKLGIPYEKFDNYSQEFDDNAMREWVADILMKSSEFNYKVALKKAGYLQRVFPYLIIEVISMLLAILTILVSKL
jgi:hypothetical protein